MCSADAQDKAITKMGMLLEQAEKIYFEAYRLQGWEFVLEEPLWLSWTLERFGTFSLLHRHRVNLTCSRLPLAPVDGT